MQVPEVLDLTPFRGLGLQPGEVLIPDGGSDSDSGSDGQSNTKIPVGCVVLCCVVLCYVMLCCVV